MCDAVVGPRRKGPEVPKSICIFMVLVTMSMVTIEFPVAGDGVGGNSLAPLRVAVNVTLSALSGIE
jgi:hypothetical protein